MEVVAEDWLKEDKSDVTYQELGKVLDYGDIESEVNLDYDKNSSLQHLVSNKKSV